MKRKFSAEENKETLCEYDKEWNLGNNQLDSTGLNTRDATNERKKSKILSESVRFDSMNYNPYLFSTVMGVDDIYNRDIAVDLKTILSENCESLIESVHFNYCFDIPWLISKYPKSARNKPVLLVHGFTGSEKLTFEGEAMNYENVDLVHAKLPFPYGTHHSKMMFLSYSNGFKVVIHTANLVPGDWFQKTQGIWISPMFSLKSSTYYEENDIFKKDLLEYLSAYKSLKLSQWMNKIHKYDMTHANVRIISSVPGKHIGKTTMNKWGHMKLRTVLSESGPDKFLVTNEWPVIGQFSSIGSLGEDSLCWLCSEWLQSLSCCKDEREMLDANKAGNLLSMVFPTVQNVRESLEGYSAGGSLCYGERLAQKQGYLKEHFCQWVANDTGRSLASPHIKSYARISPDSKSCAWFLLTSANLSKAAWGVFEKEKSQLMIRSYEIGVLFLPEGDFDGQQFFNLEKYQLGTNKQSLRLPYDVPLTPYSLTDEPWVWDVKYTDEDSNGQLWIPS